jgi:hypothetical protein
MPELEVDPRITIPFRFKKRPLAISPDFRKDWKIALLLLILEICSRGGKSSLKRLHVISWAIKTSKHQLAFDETRHSESHLFSFRIRFEPALSRAIEYAEAQKLIAWIDGDRVQITELGQSLARTVIQREDVLSPEKQFLNRIGKSITETEAMKLLAGARIG